MCFTPPLLPQRGNLVGLQPQHLLQLASPWLDRLSKYSKSLKQLGRLRRVTITASISVTSLWILPRLAAFQDVHPNIDVCVLAHTRVLNLKQENIDLAIRYAREGDVPPGAVRLFGEKVLPMASKKVAARAFKSPDALLDEVLLEFEEIPRPWLRWSDWLTVIGLPDAKPKAYLHLNQYDQVIQA